MVFSLPFGRLPDSDTYPKFLNSTIPFSWRVATTHAEFLVFAIWRLAKLFVEDLKRAQLGDHFTLQDSLRSFGHLGSRWAKRHSQRYETSLQFGECFPGGESSGSMG